VGDRRFAGWVEPIARLLAADHAELVGFARRVRPEAWDAASEVPGWTNKHILAHVAGGNDQLVQIILRKVIAGEPLEASLLDVDTDAENAARVAERIAWPVERLIAELEDGEEEMQALLSQLTQEDRDYRQGGFPMTLGQFLLIVEKERHDMLHLEQLKKTAQ
jgi:uncharacterized protein (TIGR03083 family)